MDVSIWQRKKVEDNKKGKKVVCLFVSMYVLLAVVIRFMFLYNKKYRILFKKKKRIMEKRNNDELVYYFLVSMCSG